MCGVRSRKINDAPVNRCAKASERASQVGSAKVASFIGGGEAKESSTAVASFIGGLGRDEVVAGTRVYVTSLTVEAAA